ncbi:MAG: hypothetical protein ABI337_07865 [Nitrososphaera sp.]|jgi:hypothetical protein
MESEQIKDILYDKIRRITDDQIQVAISSNGKAKIVQEILQDCFKQISRTEDKPENFVICAEGLTHYVLTNMLIPSQRKIEVNGIEVDIVIPDSRTLLESPTKSLVLYFVKTGNDQIITHLERLQKIQPKKDNIWVISKSVVPSQFRTYDVMTNFSTMFDDIDDFIAKRSKIRFRIFKS